MMKKYIIVAISLLVLIGCSPFQDTSYRVENLDINLTKDGKARKHEILRVDDNYIYMNELDTMTNPFLFITNQLILLNLDGKVYKEFPITTGKSIVDFIFENNEVYYFNYVMNTDNNNQYAEYTEYTIELCVLDNKNQEKIIQSFSMLDYEGIPQFRIINNQYHFKIGNSLYRFEKGQVSEVFQLEDADWVLASQDEPDEKIYYRVFGIDDVRLYCFEKGKSKELEINGNISEFNVVGNVVYYQQSSFIYAYHIKNKSNKVLYDKKEVLDFKILDNNTLVVTTDSGISFINAYSGEVKKDIQKNEDNDMMESEGKIYNYGKNIYLDNTQPNRIHRIHIPQEQ